MQTDIAQQLTETLNKTFKFNQFRPGQLEGLIQLMQQGRLLCIQPTGYGKSLLYQLPAVLLDGITLVISPLLALMRDQLTQLQNRFGITAVSINTDQDDSENHAARQAVLAGNARILFIAPEQLDHIDRLAFLLGLPISLLVVDEAHCISTWGHDFRPSYRQIIQVVHALVHKNPQLKLLALTATANAKTEADIRQQLAVDERTVVVQRESMDRPNIRLRVIPVAGMSAKLVVLTQLLTTLEGTGLIYCATRENTELAAEYLSAQGIKTTAYHAGFDTEHKRRIQQEFLLDKYKVITATNALGMGIDKSNLRFIIHFDFPGSITAYYQEVGRCGRDGLAADGIVLYDAADSKIQRHFIESAQPSVADFDQVLSSVKDSSVLLGLTALKTLTGLHPTRLTVIVAELIEQKFLKKVSHNGLQVYQFTNQSGVPDLSRYSAQFRVRTAELAAMQHYAEQAQQCLMMLLRTALGDAHAAPCGQCSVCDASIIIPPVDKNLLLIASAWLDKRAVPIMLSKRIKNTMPGVAVLDGKLRSQEFIGFMRNRSISTTLESAISGELLKLIQAVLQSLMQQYQFSCIVAAPSRTWSARDAIVAELANHLRIPALPDLLYWNETPQARQGELLNNDQRRDNVAQRMQVKLTGKTPVGPILLLDDYMGSGATLNEAARALNQHLRIKRAIVPFTIAAVKWHLGRRGMV